MMINSNRSLVERPLVAGKRRNDSGTSGSTTNFFRPKGRLICVLTLCLGLAFIANGLYIPAKATVAQWLLDRAWNRSVEHDMDVSRPWPWADTSPIARIKTEIGGRVIDQLILSGASDRNLAFGPAHVLPSARPGRSGHVVISGHRDTHLNWLAQLSMGTQVTLEGRRSNRIYEVVLIEVIDLVEQQFHLSSDEDLLTLSLIHI